MKKNIYHSLVQSFLAGIIIVGFGSMASAQNEEDALRYSLTKLSGTARYTAMGGAFTALGGDLSSVSLNPAAIGVYRRSEFSFTPAFNFQDTEASYNGTNSEESRLNFHTGKRWLSWKLSLFTSTMEKCSV